LSLGTIYNNKQFKKHNHMGCGCKNNNQAQPQTQQQVQAAQVVKQQQSESIKQAIKKTVEKYYNVNKTTK
jgi:hypothetical protein